MDYSIMDWLNVLTIWEKNIDPYFISYNKLNLHNKSEILKVKIIL